MLNQDTQNNTTAPTQAFSQSALLGALLYVANNAQKSPRDSVRDICNEAFEMLELPIVAKWTDAPDQPISFHI